MFAIITKDNVPIKNITTFKHNGNIQKLITFENTQEIRAFLATNQPFNIIGAGSNTIINPDHSNNVFIKISETFIPIQHQDHILTVSAGFPSQKLVSYTQTNNLSKLEFLAGVPASIGGMIAMNFGCFGHYISNIIHEITAIDLFGNEIILKPQECNFEYRSSIFKKENYIITSAKFITQKKPNQEIKNQITQYLLHRKERHPINKKTFGCIFKNPPTKSAGKIIEDLGLKGYKYKNIQISTKHANFLINLGNVEFNDIIYVINKIKTQSKNELNIELEPEVHIFND